MAIFVPSSFVSRCASIVLCLLLAIALSGQLQAQPMQITGVSPAANKHNAAQLSDITAQFSYSLNAATVSSATIRIYGDKTGLISTSGVFSVDGTTATFNYNAQFKPGELVYISATSAVQSSTGLSLAAKMWQFQAEVTTGNAYFTAPTTYATGSIPRVVKSGDFDGDGDLDLAVVNQGSDNTLIYINNGSGAFAPPVSYAVGDWVNGLETGDFNNDGVLDLVTANAVTNDATVLLGDGDGTFTWAGSYPSLGGGALQVISRDFNGDGNADLAISNFSNSILTTYMGRGNGTFTAPATYSVAGIIGFASGDFDNDGDLDLAASSNPGSSIQIMSNNGAGVFSSTANYTVSTYPYLLTTGDFNGDGNLDIAAANSGSSVVSVLMGTGAGTFSTAANYTVAQQLHNVKSGDFDGDGDLDLVVTQVWGGIGILLNNGAGVFSTTASFPTGGNAYLSFGLETGDFDGDGDIDIAATSSGGDMLSVLFNEPALRLVAHTPGAYASSVERTAAIDAEFSMPVNAASVTSANIRIWGSQSGLLSTSGTFSVNGTTATFDYSSMFRPGELITVDVTRAVRSADNATMTTATVWQFRAKADDGSGAFGSAANYATGTRPKTVALGDLNKDNVLDMVVVNETSDALSVLLGTGAGVFGVATSYSTGTLPSHVALGDFNHDGNLDLVYANSGTGVNTISLRFGTGTGAFGSAANYTAGTGPNCVDVADLNGDGHLDFAVSNNNDISILFNKGDGTLSAAVHYTAGTLPRFIRSGDIDGDGDLDIAATNVSSDNVSILLNRGNGTFASAVQYGSVDSPQEVEFADFNGDGAADIATVNLNTGTLSVFPGTGTGSLGAQTNYPLTGQPYSLAVGDYDSDGDLDIATALFNTPKIAVLANDGAGSFSTPVFFQANSSVSKVQTGDVNNDGILDLVTSELNNSRVAVILGYPKLRVVSHTPAAHAVNVDAGSNIDITFSHALKANTVSTASIVVQGGYTGTLSTRSTLAVGSTTASFDYNSMFKPGELVSVSVTPTVQSTTGVHLAKPEVWQFRTAVRGGYGHLYRSSALGADYVRDVILGDIDGDGDLDAITFVWQGYNNLWINDGLGGFTYNGYIGTPFAENFAGAFGDLDNDGDLDVTIGVDWGKNNEVWLNGGSGNFSYIGTVGTTKNTLNMVLGDIDGDGDPDAVISNWQSDNTVWMNNGAGAFALSTASTLGVGDSHGIALGDLDNDGDLDAAIANSTAPSTLWFNNGRGVFTGTTATLGSTGSYDVTFGDIDGDGDLDAALANSGIDNSIWINDGAGHFSVSTATLGVGNSMSVSFGDLDGDGDLDAIVGRTGGDTTTLWLNNGAGQFAQNTTSNLSIGDTQEVALGDLDGDGDLDAFVGGPNEVWLNGPQLAITAVAPATPYSGDDIVFSIRSQNPDGTPYVVSTTTTIQLSWDTASLPFISGVTQATIAAGTSTATMTISVLAAEEMYKAFNASVVTGASLSGARTWLWIEPRCESVVTNTNDDGIGSLRRAVASTCTGGTITFATSGTIVLTTGQLHVQRNVTIDATTASITVSGNNASRVFFITATVATISNLSITSGTILNDNGGAIYSSTGTLTLQHVSVRGSSAYNNGGAVGGLATMLISHSTFSGNHAGNNGGAIFSFGNITLDSCMVSGNSAGNNGGAIASFGKIVLDSCVVSGNSTGNNGGAIGGFGIVEILHSVLSGNTSGNTGGAVLGNNNVAIAQSTLSNNTAGNVGGAVNSGHRLVITDAVFTGNRANNSGGVFSADTAIVSNTTMYNNSASNSGGAMSNRYYLNIAKSTITNNAATNGGAISNQGIVVLSNTTIANNSASSDGGGIYSFSSQLTLDTVVISNNRAGDQGGGMHLTTSSAILSNSTINDNSAKEGGGIYNTGTISANNSAIYNNKASLYGGGGVYTGGVFNALNTTLSGNTSAADGGAVAVRAYGVLRATSATIAANTAGVSGGGIVVGDSASAGLLNTIIADNIASVGRDISGGINAGITSSGYNLIGTTATVVVSWQGSDITGRGAGLAPLANYGGTTATMRPNIGSLALEAGTSTTSKDQRGYPRPIGTNDIGAFEANYNYALTGTPQTVLIGTAIPQPLGIVLTESGQPVVGAQLVLSAPATGASIVFPNGTTTTTLTTNSIGATSTTATAGSVAGSVSVSISGSASVFQFLLQAQPVVSTSAAVVSTDEDVPLLLIVQLADDSPASSIVLTATSSNLVLIPDISVQQASATGATTSFLITPAEDLSGTGLITITATDPDGYTSSTTFTVNVLPVNDAPRPVTRQTLVVVDEDTTGLLTVAVIDVDNSYDQLVVTATSGNQSLIENAALVQSGATGATTSFVFTPVANANGTTSVFVTASDGELSTSLELTVTILPINDAPVVSTTQTIIATNENTATTLTVSVIDVDNSYGQLTLTAVSDNQLLLPDANISQSGAVGATTSFVLTPATNQSGSAHITLTVGDGQYSATTTLTLVVNTVNYPPTVSTTETVVTTNEDTPTELVVAISDANNAFGELVVTATSANQSLIPDAVIVMQGSTASTIVFAVSPAANQYGSAQITVRVSDGVYSASTTMTVMVLPVNDAPVASTTQTAVAINEDGATTLTIAVSDVDNSYEQLTVTAVSDNQGLIANSGLAQSSSTGATTSFVVVPAANMNGTAHITLSVSDGVYTASTTITVMVPPVNDAPAASTTQTAVVINEDGATTLTIAVSDIDNSYGQLTVTAVSDNQGLIANSGLVQSGSTNATTSFAVTPIANMSGTAHITLSVNDGVYTASTTMTVTVLPVNDSPVVSAAQTAVTINEDGTTTLTIAMSDIDNSYAQLTVTAVSDNQSLIANSGIAQSGSTNATTSFVVTPIANTSGTAHITLSVSDGGYTVNTTITVTVLPVNDAPVVSAIQTAVTINEDGTTTLTIAVSDIDNSYAQLTVTAMSDNQSLIANSGVVQSSSTNATTSFAVTPVANMNGTAHITLSVSDGVYISSTTITIAILPVNDAPVVSVNSGLTVHEGSTAVLSSAVLAVSDIEQAASGLVFTVTSATVNGTLLNNGATSATFTQADINGGLVSYRHNGSETLADSFAFSVSDGAGGTATGVFVIAVLPVNDAPVAIADEDSTCLGNPVVVRPLGNDSDRELNKLTISSATQPQHGTMSIAAGDTAVVYTPNAFFQGTDIFTYTISDGMGGSSTATVVVQVRSTVQASAGEDMSLCRGASAQLSGAGVSTLGDIEFTWTPATGLSNARIANPIAQPDTTTTYILTVVDGNGCHAADTLVVSVLAPAVHTVSADTAICAGSSAQLYATGGASYLWSPAAGLSSTSIANPVASPATTTTYTVQITAASGCRVTTTVTVQVYNAVQADAGSDTTLCAGSDVQLAASGGTSYQWTPTAGLSNAFIANPIASPLQTTTYTVTVRNAAGCESRDEVTITVLPIALDVQVMLEGPYTGVGMATNLQAQGIIPAAQPYNTAPFNYAGSEVLSTTSTAVVDWVLVELRAGVDANTSVGRKAALLLSDGHIVESDGSALHFANLNNSSYHIVVYHRNHLGVMTATTVSAGSDCLASYNFTASATSAYEIFMEAQKEIGTGVWGMASGDVNSDGIVNAQDRVMVRNDAGLLGYRATDLSLDGIVNAVDRVISRNNTFRTSQLP